MSTGPTLIASVQRAFRLLEAVGAHETGAPAKQLAREAGPAVPAAEPGSGGLDGVGERRHAA
ncbi:hypothetical protein [Streptomyces hirsutus]|uniref:hypothetical protein n=1 Tax=Streptomyces hirsutus TaxID=35620 RepID=UPI003F4D07FD